MAKNKKDASAPATPTGATDTPAAPPTEASPPSNGGAGEEKKNGFSDSRKPIKVLTYQIGHDVFVQASIWDRTVEKKDGLSFVTYDVSVRKRYRDAVTKEWKNAYSFHATELFAVAHAIVAAGAAILELRAVEMPF